MKATINNLTEHGKCPLDYGKVIYNGSSYKCTNCGAKLDKEHVLKGRNSLDRVNGKPPLFT